MKPRAEVLHVVDLDGALRGKSQWEIIKSITSQTRLLVQLGGGLRDMESLKWADSIGVNRMVIGSAAAGTRQLASAVKYTVTGSLSGSMQRRHSQDWLDRKHGMNYLKLRAEYRVLV